MVVINKQLRDADPDSCARIDELRLERKPLAGRLCYLQTGGNHHATAASEAIEIAQKMAELDKKVADLHANARATAAKAKSAELRTASAAISITKADSEKLLCDMMSWAKTAGICCAMRRELFCMKNGSRGLFDTGHYVLATVVLSHGTRVNRCHAAYVVDPNSSST